MISKWNLCLGIFGTLLWVTLFFNLEQVSFIIPAMGYLLGFIVFYGFYLFRSKLFLSIFNSAESIYAKVLTGLMLIFILIGGLLGIIMRVNFFGIDFVSLSFGIPFSAGAFVVGKGLFPIINYKNL
jgi:hypothetical protein